MALTLLGALGGAVLAKGCAPVEGPLDDSQPYDPELPPDAVAQGLTGATSVRWFDTYTELRGVSGGTNTTDVNVALGRDLQLGGLFAWTTDTSTSDDGGIVIVPSAMPRTGCWKRIFSGPVNVQWFGATGDISQTGTAVTTAINNAYSAATSRKKELYFPAGDYVIQSTIQMLPPSFSGNFGNGARIIGDGIGATIFHNGVSSGVMFDVAAQTGTIVSFKGALGCLMRGFSVKLYAGTTSTTAIRLNAAFMCKLEQLHITGMAGNGVEIKCSYGDLDGSNMVGMEHVRIDNCSGWGIKADADSGYNETSFLTMFNVFVEGCGTASDSTPPPSGGMIYKGAILTMVGCAFTVSQNVALFIKGQSGLGLCVDIQDTGFENSIKRGIYCTGVASFKARNIEVKNNNTYIATRGIEFDGSSFLVRRVEIDGVMIRASSSNNAYTAFKLSGANVDIDTCRVKNVYWSDFDYSGQTRFDGWKFDAVPQLCDLVLISNTILRLTPNATLPRGNSMPLRLAGAAGGTASTSGEWVETNIDADGESITNAGLSANTQYYCYLRDNNGSRILELSTTGPTRDSFHGYTVKTGDATQLYVGSVETDGSGNFKTTGGGWLNPLKVPGTAVGSFWYMWVDSSGKLRITSSAALPTSDTSGTVVGTQT